MLASDDNVIDIIWGAPLCQVIVDSANIVDVQETALRLSEESRIILDCIALCWGVNDREHLFEVVLDQLLCVRMIEMGVCWRKHDKQ